jgi:MFS family permease
MSAIWSLLRHDAPARRFLVAYGQSSLGTGAGYVAVLALAYSRWQSPWSVPLALAAETIPVMLLGPLLGALADRLPRRGCLVASDVLRTVAFAGIAFVPSFPALIAFILLAGVGFGLFNAAALATLPSLSAPERQATATSLYSALGEAGYVLGPVLAVPLLVTGDGTAIAAVNALSFGLSAVLLAGLPRQAAPQGDAEAPPSLVRSAIDGLRTAWQIPGVPALMTATTIFVLVFCTMNAGELLLVRSALHAGNDAFALLVAASGIGIVAGALLAGGDGPDDLFRRRYLVGLVAASGGLLAAGVAPSVAAAVTAFIVAGAGNGYAVASERVLLQRWVPDELRARVFGAKHAAISTAMVVSYAVSGALLAIVGPRAVFVGAGVAGLLAAAVAVRLLREVTKQTNVAAGPVVA